MRFVVIILLLLFPLLSHGEVYRWVDENGQIHFGSVPPRLQKPYVPGEVEIKESQQGVTVNENQKKSKKNELSTKETDKNIAIEKNRVVNGQGKDRNDKDNGEITILQFKPKTEAEKKLDLEQKKNRDEKFNALINRLKTDLGTINNPETEIQEEKKGKQQVENIEGNDKTTGKKENVDDINKSHANNNKVNINNENEAKKEIESVERAVVKDNEKCGFFKSFVENYEDRVRYECPSEHCDILYKKLEKYRNKVKQYCGAGTLGGVLIEAD